MRVSGFTILRDVVMLDYPFEQSLRSILNLVDEFVVNVGDCRDDTLERVLAIDSPKIRVLRSTWDPALFRDGLVMAQQTNVALEACTGDWCFYLQADEVLHERDLPLVRRAMERYWRWPRITGLSFRYLHFRGSYAIRDPLSYRRQIRVVRGGVGVRSVGDACGFELHGQPLCARSSGARMFHYGWVRPPRVMSQKHFQFSQLYDGPAPPDVANSVQLRDWEYDLKRCVAYTGEHPAVMRQRIAAQDWELPAQPLLPAWRNPAFWAGLYYKNSRIFRRWMGRERRRAA